jgi:cytochrome c5
MLSAARPPLPEGSGRGILESSCTACHALDIVTEKRWSNQQWRDSVNAMIARGASLNKDQAADLVAYLGKHFGTRNRARDLFVDICSSCHSLERVDKQALSKEQWSTFIKGMISEGNPVNDEEFALLVDYLAEHFGEKK